MNKKAKKRFHPLRTVYILTAFSTLLYILFIIFPAFADWFTVSIGCAVRNLLATVSGLLPFSLTELLLLLIPLWFYLLIRLAHHYIGSLRQMLHYFGILVAGICTVWILFVWTFAAGYYGTTLDKKLMLDRQPVSAEELYQTASILSAQLEKLTDEILFMPSGASAMPFSYSEMTQKLLEAYDTLHNTHPFISLSPGRIKPIMLSEPMSYTHITGVYTFFTGEANLNVNFPDYTLPFTAAHELAHQRGIAREDEANFVAFLVCMESSDPYIRYSGLLNLYDYVISALSQADRKLFTEQYATLPVEIRRERSAYGLFFEKYRDNIVADISNATNDLYLQSQGNAAGAKSYGMVVELAVAYYRPIPYVSQHLPPSRIN